MLVATFLAKHDACEDGAAFALKYKTMEQVWKKCNRSDWMLWILNHTKPMPDKMARKFACWCARNTPLADGRTTWDLLTDERSRNAVVVAEWYAAGKATDKELAAARTAAWAAVGAAAWAARDASWAAARTASWAASWAGDAAGAAQCHEIRRLIPSLTKWTAKPKKTKRKP